MEDRACPEPEGGYTHYIAVAMKCGHALEFFLCVPPDAAMFKTFTESKCPWCLHPNGWSDKAADHVHMRWRGKLALVKRPIMDAATYREMEVMEHEFMDEDKGVAEPSSTGPEGTADDPGGDTGPGEDGAAGERSEPSGAGADDSRGDGAPAGAEHSTADTHPHIDRLRRRAAVRRQDATALRSRPLWNDREPAGPGGSGASHRKPGPRREPDWVAWALRGAAVGILLVCLRRRVGGSGTRRGD